MSYIIPPVNIKATVSGNDLQVIPAMCEIEVYQGIRGEISQLFKGRLVDGTKVQALIYSHEDITDYSILTWKLEPGATIPETMRRLKL